MLNRYNKWFHYAAWVIFAVILILIICTFRQYGVTWDEELQSQYGQAIDDYYASGFQDHRYAEILNLYLYGGMFDGLAAFFNHYTPLQVYDARHLLNALFGLLGLWGVWRLGRFLGGNFVGLIALILCVTTPMYYGHMYNNPKDIPFAAGIVWSLYFMFRSYSKSELSLLLKLGIVLGLTCGVRVGGVMLFVFWLVVMGLLSFQPLLRQRDEKTAQIVIADILHRMWRIVLPVAVIAYGVMLVCWPWAQQHPMTNPLRAISEFSDFPHNVKVLLDGTSYYSKQLPWYYIPLYFGIKLPELLLFLLALAILFVPKIWRQFTPVQKYSFALMLLMVIFPIFYAIIRHSSLYDCVRHFLFAVPLLCVIAALAARNFFVWCVSNFDRQRSRRAMSTMLFFVFGIGIVIQIAIMVQLHPYEYIYANQFAGGVSGAYGRYESDYWGESFKEAAEKIQAFVAKEGGVPPGKIYKIAICGPWDSAMIYLPPNYERVDAKASAEFFLSTTRWMCQDMRVGKEIIRVERMGAPLSIVKDLRGG